MNENIQKIIKNILRDIQVEMTDEFDQNFERQAFFSQAWQRRKSPTRPRGHILVDTGQLRRSIKSRTTDNSVIFYTDLPYAEIHNDGGEIVVTPRMLFIPVQRYEIFSNSQLIQYDDSLLVFRAL
ncbi:MAG: phage virion morphogenesis protein [Prevotella sp.]|nr:phage virion morphogenesis protein [Prevotella sp.]